MYVVLLVMLIEGILFAIELMVVWAVHVLIPALHHTLRAQTS